MQSPRMETKKVVVPFFFRYFNTAALENKMYTATFTHKHTLCWLITSFDSDFGGMSSYRNKTSTEVQQYCSLHMETADRAQCCLCCVGVASTWARRARAPRRSRIMGLKAEGSTLFSVSLSLSPHLELGHFASSQTLIGWSPFAGTWHCQTGHRLLFGVLDA